MDRRLPMAEQKNTAQPFNIMIVGQAGRVQYEALVFAASLRAMSPGFPGTLYVAEPQPGRNWQRDPRMRQDVRTALIDLGAEVVPFQSRHFGQSYPHGNKIEGLEVLPRGEPFVFFDSDTLVTGDLAGVPFDFARPAASMKRTGTWPVEELYWPGYTAIWRSLYDKFGLEFETSLDLSQPDEYWQRYLYFNAGWFFGADPVEFGRRFTRMAVAIRDDPPPELVIQPMTPWLDQVTLPLVVHSLGGGRPGPELNGLDGKVTCHYRTLPLLYARESAHVIDVLEAVCTPNRLKRVLKDYEPLRKMVYHGQGAKARALFDQENLPAKEEKLRKKLRAEGYWLR